MVDSSSPITTAGSGGASSVAAICCAALIRLRSCPRPVKHMNNEIPREPMMAGKVMDKEMILKTLRLPLALLLFSENDVQEFSCKHFIEIE